MFRVPANPTAPTFDDTFKVGFWRWIGTSFSKKGAAERHEWTRRRRIAAPTGRVRVALQAKEDAIRADHEAKKAARRS